jgi:hypothetical protein
MLIRRSDVLQERYRDQPDVAAHARRRNRLSGDEIGHPGSVERDGHVFSLRSETLFRQWKDVSRNGWGTEAISNRFSNLFQLTQKMADYLWSALSGE